MRTVLAMFFTLMMLSACTKSKSMENGCENSIEGCAKTPIIMNPHLDRMQLFQAKILARFNHKASTTKLIEHYGDLVDIPNLVYWCYKGAELATNRGIFCAAGFEIQMGHKINCKHVIDYYRDLVKSDMNVANIYIETFSLSVKGTNIYCTGSQWDHETANKVDTEKRP